MLLWPMRRAACRTALVLKDTIIFLERPRTYGNHVGGHTVTNEQEDVLGLPDRLDVADEPLGNSLRTGVVGKGGSVLHII